MLRQGVEDWRVESVDEMHSNSEPRARTRKALITGGTKGVGFAVATELLSLGFDVVLTYSTDQAAAQSAVHSLALRFPNARISSLQADSTKFDSIDAIESHLLEAGLRLDALILNAGLTDRSSLEDMQVDNWERVLMANLTFPTFLVQRLLPMLHPGSSVIFTGSLMGIHPHSMSLPYGVTKSATHALVENLVKFLSPYGVRVNGVAPGFVDTEWQKSKPQAIRGSINSKTAAGRFADPLEVANVYSFLIENTYINGEIVKIDGGYSYR